MSKKKQIPVVYEDSHLLVVDKPAPLHCIPDRFDANAPNLRDMLAREYGELLVVHRIDSETSGLVCFAKTEEAHRALSTAFMQRKVGKGYLAIVAGNLPQAKGEVDMPIAPAASRKNFMRINFASGKPSQTLYEVLETFKHYSLLKVSPVTGRMHQIRVHLMALGYPLAVDEVYGGKDGFYLSEVKRHYNLNRHGEERPVMGRVSLHAHKLAFVHPVTAEPLELTAEPPKDFEAVLRLLRKYDAPALNMQ